MPKVKKLMSSGFHSPNFTQVPNDFFTLIPDMEDTELRVTLVMIRETFGYHRSDFRMGIKKLATAAGLSLNGARVGAKAAQKRGTFSRVNPGEQGSAEWELVVEHSNTEGAISEGDAMNEPLGVQPVNTRASTSEGQSGIKKSIKEKERTTTPNPNNFRIYEENIGPLTPLISDSIKDAECTYSSEWLRRAILEAAKSNVRNMKYIESILQGYKKRGSPDIGRDFIKGKENGNAYKTSNPKYTEAHYAAAAEVRAELVSQKERRSNMP
jgi:DnaD/phage-associated family protein